MAFFRCGGGDVTPLIVAMAARSGMLIGTGVSEAGYQKITFTVPDVLVGKYIYLYFDQYGDYQFPNPSADRSERFGSYSGIDITTEEILYNFYSGFLAKYKVISTSVTLKSYHQVPSFGMIGFGLVPQINYPQGD